MGDSLKEFLASRSRPLDDIPSEKYPNGKSYSFTSPPWKTCLTLKAMFLLGVRTAVGTEPEVGELDRLASELIGEQTEDAQANGQHFEELLYRKVMGDTYDELEADGVDGDTMEAVFQLLLRKYGGGQDIAVQLAEVKPAEDAAGEAEAQPNRQTRRAAGRKAGSSSSPASGATPARTRSRASTPASKTPAKPKPVRKTA